MRTISVSSHIISIEFHGGGSGSEVVGRCSSAPQPPNASARAQAHRSQPDGRFILPPYGAPTPAAACVTPVTTARL
jgi:hypothetical protein